MKKQYLINYSDYQCFCHHFREYLPYCINRYTQFGEHDKIRKLQSELINCERVNTNIVSNITEKNDYAIYAEWEIASFVRNMANCWHVEREVLEDAYEEKCPFDNKKCPYGRKHNVCELACGISILEIARHESSQLINGCMGVAI